MIGSLAAKVRSTVAPLLAPGEPVALLDFPNHMNVGDSAIWLGERALLRSLGVPVAYACDQRGYVPEHLRAALGAGGTILLHGGGNFGDLYPRHQALRERVVRDFPEHGIVQLPQTIDFEDERRLRAAGELFRSHERFTLLVRDALSLERYGPALARDVRLCPDSAFCLGALGRRGEGRGVLWLARADDEARRDGAAIGPGGTAGAAGEVGAGGPVVPEGVRRSDWPSLPAAWRRRRLLSRGLSFATSSAPPVGARLWRPASGLFDRLAAERVAAGSALLSSAGAVVTDRLHGHILALLCGVPHVLTDNRTGKVRRFHDAWTRDAALVRWADDPRAALALAAELAA
jgi:exopolysaccharide biosynthesis predicted pyruvyltransferase EpsI